MKSYLVTKGEKAHSFIRVPDEVRLTKEQEEALREALDYANFRILVYSEEMILYLTEKYKINGGSFIYDDAIGEARTIWKKDGSVWLVMEIGEETVEEAFFNQLTKYKNNVLYYEGLKTLFDYSVGGNMDEVTFHVAKSLING